MKSFLFILLVGLLVGCEDSPHTRCIKETKVAAIHECQKGRTNSVMCAVTIENGSVMLVPHLVSVGQEICLRFVRI